MLAGLGVVGVVGLMLAAVQAGSHYLTAVSGTVLLIVGYVAFLFLSFIGYAFLYQRTTSRQDADFVVVPGFGLIGGERVPPLLASRLERGRHVFEQLRESGGDPVLITSGGQGGRAAARAPRHGHAPDRSGLPRRPAPS
ncbi:hypothetical protein [Kitasatospora griseola]|uniref:hypothetical protein n=1 Tax=Kitasatospora griseola TaxID=2064 RepID=UPI00341BC0BE